MNAFFFCTSSLNADVRSTRSHSASLSTRPPFLFPLPISALYCMQAIRSTGYKLGSKPPRERAAGGLVLPPVTLFFKLYAVLRAGLLCSLEVGRDDDHRHRRVVDDALAHGAEDHAPEPPAPAAAHDDGVRLALLGEPEELPRRVVPEEELGVHVEP